MKHVPSLPPSTPFARLPGRLSGGFDALPVACAATTLVVVAALYAIFFYAPVERSMGIVQKIFYFHVPAAIAAYAGFLLCAVGSVYFLIRNDVRGDIVAQAGAECGVLFCFMVLASGPLWARKAWGTFWTGEPRLMLTLVLMLIFCAYLVVRSFGGRSEMTRKICSILAILGVANIPLVRYSVTRWRGNHPQVITGEGGGITDEMQLALTLSFAAVGMLFATLVWFRVRLGMAEEAIESYHRHATRRADRLDLDATH